MSVSDVCSFQKKGKSVLSFENQRGISLITVFKKTMENLLFQDMSKDIDEKMSNSNIGARKNRNIKDHLLIMHGIIYSVIKGKEESIDIQIFDLEKAFDSL